MKTIEQRNAEAEMTRQERKQHAARMEACKAQARATVATGKCPDCGLPLLRNSALAGWYQCAAYATPSFRLPQYRDAASCHFQCFTE